MKVAILTTNTLHHKYFISQICHAKNEVLCVIENNIIKPKFNTKIDFEKKKKNLKKKNGLKIKLFISSRLII